MTNYTSGPWTVEHEEWTEGRGLLITAAKGPVALIDPEVEATPEDFANARLIAEAPELLKTIAEALTLVLLSDAPAYQRDMIAKVLNDALKRCEEPHQ